MGGWSDKTEIPACRFAAWIGIASSKFHDWKRRFGKVNEHNALVPRDHWLTDDEKEKIDQCLSGPEKRGIVGWPNSGSLKKGDRIRPASCPP